jgi:hypothetical protein
MLLARADEEESGLCGIGGLERVSELARKVLRVILLQGYYVTRRALFGQ